MVPEDLSVKTEVEAAITGDPNTEHQVWSEWTVTVHAAKPCLYWQVRKGAAPNLKKIFGSATRVKIDLIDPPRKVWRIRIQTEGHPVQEPGYREHVERNLRRIFEHGFGPGTRVHVAAHLLSGEPENGGPRKRLLALPLLRIPEVARGRSV